ncbi:Uncharacterised protein [Legionella lansingensis]|nr:Uncharacterised protein [Legionella lansingensis]
MPSLYPLSEGEGKMPLPLREVDAHSAAGEGENYPPIFALI